jgi:hypothetical protein
MIDYTRACEHHRLTPSAACYIYPNADGGSLYCVAVAAACPDCGAKFQFLGNNPLAPSTYEEAQKERLGAWVSPNLQELACMIAPVEPSGGLADAAILGRA